MLRWLSPRMGSLATASPMAPCACASPPTGLRLVVLLRPGLLSAGSPLLSALSALLQLLRLPVVLGALGCLSPNSAVSSSTALELLESPELLELELLELELLGVKLE